jgi:hypothetical protein
VPAYLHAARGPPRRDAFDGLLAAAPFALAAWGMTH